MKKDFSALFKESLDEYGKKFMQILQVFLFLYLIPIFAIAMIFILIVISFLGINFLTGMSVSDLESSITGLATSNSDTYSNIFIMIFLIFFILLLIFLILQMLASICFLNIGFSKKQDISFKEIFNKSRPYLMIYLGLAIVQGLALFGLYLLLIIPGIIFSVYWMFSPYILINEKKGIINSMRESKKLVDGKWWTIFSYTLLIFLIIIAVNIIASFIPLLGSFIPYLVTTPFVILFYKNLYLDIKGNKKSKKK